MTAVADEMEFVLLRSSFSSIITEALDATCAVFDAEGRTVAQACAIPVHLGVLCELGALDCGLLSRGTRQGGRCVHRQRSVCRRHPPSRYLRRLAGFLPGAPRGIRGHHGSSSGYRRVCPGEHVGQRLRPLRRGHSHTAYPACRRGRFRRRHHRSAGRQQPVAGQCPGGPQRADRGLQAGRGTSAGGLRRRRDRGYRLRRRRADGLWGAIDPLGDRAHPRR